MGGGECTPDGPKWTAQALKKGREGEGWGGIGMRDGTCCRGTAHSGRL